MSKFVKASITTTPYYEFGPFRVDVARRLLLRDTAVVPLTPKTFDTLLVLVENSGRVLEKDELMKMLWPDSFVEERNLIVNISALRKALGESASDHRYVVTLPGQGYRFVAEVKPLQRDTPDLLVQRRTQSRITIRDEQTGDEKLEDPAWARAPIVRVFSFQNVFQPRLNRAILVISLLLVSITGVVAFWRSNHQAALAAVTRNDAREAYQQGRFFWNTRTNEGLAKSIAYFEQAIRKDPTYALGYAGLADAYAFDMMYWPKAEEMANKALAIDSTLAEPHATLGFISMFWKWRWEDAEREFKRAIELDPNYATAHQWFAIYIAAHTLRFNWAKIEMQKALELDPSSLAINADLGQIHYFAHEYDQAIAACRKTLEIDPDFLNAHAYLYQTYTQRGLSAEAAEEFFKFQKLVGDKLYTDPASEEALRKAYTADGIGGIWRASLDLFREGYTVDAYAMAEYYALLGENDNAFGWLEKAFETHNFAFVFVKANPVFDHLHKDRRFQDLLVRAGFASPENFR